MSDNIVPLFGDPHRDTQMLLPWYVSGRLDEADLALVESHLETCEECRAELQLERRLAGEVAALPNEAIADIGLSPATKPLRRWRTVAPWVGWAAAAALAIVVLRPSPAPQSPTYHTLSAAPPAGDLVVIFRPDTTEAAMRGILRQSSASLVGGPTEADAYVLRAPRARLDRITASLRARHEVVLAEPVGQGR
jgi:anti-sigma factor RsiW